MSSIRLGLAASLVIALAGCSGGGLGSILGPITGGNGSAGFQCDTGTSVQLANPEPNQTGVSPGIGQIVIVANGKNNNLYNTYNQWNITLSDQYGDTITGSNLQPYSYPGGPQPYQSDYYYYSQIGQLPQGVTWNVSLGEPGASCSAVPLNSFST
ncbi:MAG TPA: hypothetical protein VIO32_00110 [Candidatus Baltobacteraceae bacterium]